MKETEVRVTERSKCTLYMWDIGAGLHFQSMFAMDVAVVDLYGVADESTVYHLPAGTLFLVPGCIKCNSAEVDLGGSFRWTEDGKPVHSFVGLVIGCLPGLCGGSLCGAVRQQLSQGGQKMRTVSAVECVRSGHYESGITVRGHDLKGRAKVCTYI
jgi:hypothetical protein